MAVDLTDFVPSLRREVEPPGTNLFADATDEDWVGYLSDAFWEARLDGFLEGYIVDEADSIVPANAGAPDLDRASMALVILYAGIRVLRNRILNQASAFRAKAGPVEYEQTAYATVLAEMLKQLRQTKDRIMEQLDADETNVLVLDAYSTRVFSPLSYRGGIELMG